VRLFAAVWPPAEVIEVLAAIDRPAIDGLRWTKPEQWHVTLRFLGEVADERVADAEDVVRAVASELSPAEAVVAERLARFGRDIAHVQVSGLRAWGEAFAAAFDTARIGPGSDGRAFIGHITIARAVRRGGGVLSVSGAPLPRGAHRWTATEVALVRSVLGPGGARYSDLAVVPVG
jgi:2'-5' RNA ligase